MDKKRKPSPEETQASVAEWIQSLPVAGAAERPFGEVFEHPASLEGRNKTGFKGAARKLLEEAVELGLAAGLAPADVLLAVTDSIANQARKAAREKRVDFVFPSQMEPASPNPDEVKEEAADVQIALWHFCTMAHVDLKCALVGKMGRFRNGNVVLMPDGSYYRRVAGVKFIRK